MIRSGSEGITLVPVADDARFMRVVSAGPGVSPLRVVTVKQRPLVPSTRHVGHQDGTRVQRYVHVRESASEVQRSATKGSWI